METSASALIFIDLMQRKGSPDGEGDLCLGFAQNAGLKEWQFK